MADPQEAIQYWDSCMFISMLTGEHPSRIPVIRQLLEHEKAGAIQIVVSTFAIAEIRPAQSSRAQDDAIVGLLSSDRLLYYPLTESIAQNARQIGTEFPTLKPGDCVHIATALEAKAGVMFTFDGARMNRRQPAEMIAHSGKIGNPPLQIMEPDAWHGTMFAGST